MYSVSLPFFFSLTVQPCNIICSAWVLAHKAEHMILQGRRMYEIKDEPLSGVDCGEALYEYMRR